MARHARRDLVRFLGATGAVALAGCIGGSGPQVGDGDDTDTETNEPIEADHVVTVGPGGDLRYDPADLRVAVDSTVAWKWDSGGHTVTVEDKPQGSSWRGTNLSTKEAGYVMARTFDVEGTYEYYCTPHQSDGMTGTLVVSEETATATGGGNATATGNGTGTGTGTGTTVDGGGEDDGGGGGNY